MTRKEKNQTISDLKEKFSQYDNFYITNYMGMGVEEINELRMACHGEGIEYMVAKNTLVKKALEEREGVPEEVLASLEGPTSIFFSDVANAPAKVIKDFRKGGGELPILKVACLMTDAFVGDDKVDTLSKLKTKTELIGEVIGLLQSPMSNVIGALQSGGDTIGGIVKTLQEREQ
jgi:large subunit ribosomal protein L10